MKTLTILLLLSTTIFSQAFAKTIFIPNTPVNLYVGSFGDIEADLKKIILDKLVEECGSLENGYIGKSSITLNLSNIYQHNVLGHSEDIIQGSYPQAQAQINIECYNH